MEMLDLKTFAVKTLYLLELCFPPDFFEVMTHLVKLVVHLVEELDIFFLVHSWWCNFVECYMGVLARYMHKKARLKASMAYGYAANEVLGFCTEYFDMYPHMTRWIWDSKFEICNSGEVLLDTPCRVTLS